MNAYEKISGKRTLINQILEGHGYDSAEIKAFEIVGERKKINIMEDLDVVVFAGGLNAALNQYFKYVRGVTQNIHNMYSLPIHCKFHLINLIHVDPEFKGRLDFLLEKGLIIGPGDERKVYRQLVHFNRRAINSEVLSRSLDKVIIKVKSGIGSAKQSNVGVHDDKYCSVI